MEEQFFLKIIHKRRIPNSKATIIKRIVLYISRHTLFNTLYFGLEFLVANQARFSNCSMQKQSDHSINFSSLTEENLLPES